MYRFFYEIAASAAVLYFFSTCFILFTYFTR
mgnify:CR=1 FL=1